MEKIDKARKTLKLGERATIAEIQSAYRKLSMRYHPDKCKDKDKGLCEEKFKRINDANTVLKEYIVNYKIPLNRSSAEDLSEERHRKEHIKRFYDGWWGDIDA